MNFLRIFFPSQFCHNATLYKWLSLRTFQGLLARKHHLGVATTTRADYILAWRFSFPWLCLEPCWLNCAMSRHRHALLQRLILYHKHSICAIQIALQAFAAAALKLWPLDTQTATTIAAQPTLTFCSARQALRVLLFLLMSLLVKHSLEMATETAEHPWPPLLASLVVRLFSSLLSWISLFSNHAWLDRTCSAALLER